MDRQELIDKVINNHNGICPIPKNSGESFKFIIESVSLYGSQFKERARELGFVGETGYRYGVEYPTNGKKPDLPDGLMVQFENKRWGWNSDADGIINCEVKCWDWSKSSAFRIVDERYKPVEQKPVVRESESLLDLLNGLNETELHHVQNSEEAKELLVKLKKDHATRAKELERKRVVDAAESALTVDGGLYLALEELYDKGFLKLP